ncbi:TetR/AcrR family transcriptional regulator [Streptomyces sp. NPDC048254]|uniref:TetR/AcrR family transcriptional regulator n=1 Tax=Streptomyces sp. NPDC048254 TaxID=3365525 RepID=UPI0037216F70
MEAAQLQPRRKPQGLGGESRMGRPPLSERRKAAARLEIAKAAVELFTAQGVEGTSAGEIAEAVGISTRTLWRYFPSKEDCVAPLLASGAERLSRRLGDWPVGRPLIEALDDDDLWLADSDPDTLRVVLDLMRLTRTEPGLQSVWMRKTFDALPVVADALAARANKPVADMEARVQAGMLLSALHLALREYAWREPGEDGPELDEMLRQAARIVIRGLPF